MIEQDLRTALLAHAPLTAIVGQNIAALDAAWQKLHATRPTANADFWAAKLDGTVERDRETDTRLEAEGWTVLRFWEHEDPAEAAGRVDTAVRSRTS